GQVRRRRRPGRWQGRRRRRRGRRRRVLKGPFPGARWSPWPRNRPARGRTAPPTPSTASSGASTRTGVSPQSVGRAHRRSDLRCPLRTRAAWSESPFRRSSSTPRGPRSRWSYGDEAQDATFDESKTAAPRDELAELRRQNEELLTKLKYLQAEFENYRKRVDRDAETVVKFAHELLLSRLLPVLDEVDAAVAGIE